MPMSEPIKYLTEENYKPYWLQPEVTEKTIKAVQSKKELLIETGRKLSSHERFYMVGSGGSYSVQYPLRYIAEKYTKVPVFNFSSWDFLERKPVAVDEKAAGVFISQSGKTAEVLEAMRWFKEQGGETVGLTQKTESLINEEADYPYGWDAPGVTFGKLASMYYIFGSIFREKGYAIGDAMIETIDNLLDKLLPIIPSAKKRARKQGLAMKDQTEMFVLGGGINYGLAYQFAVCTLMEMCWVHATHVNYSEFGHGSIEVFTPGTAALFLRGSVENPVRDKIMEWAMDNGVECIEFGGLAENPTNLETPFTLFIELEWFSYYLSLAKNRDMNAWRYYHLYKF